MAGKRVPRARDLSRYEEVLAMVTANPRAWLGVGELAILFRLPETEISAVSTAKDSPFRGKNCHPAMLDEWLRAHTGFAPE